MPKKVNGTESRLDPPQPTDQGGPDGGDEKQIYLRTVYPLNPGIPHSVDFPTGWRRD